MNIINQILLDIKGKKASDTYEGNNRYLLTVALLLVGLSVGLVVGGFPLLGIIPAGVALWKLKIWWFNKK
jgi:hypothetical protein